MKNFKSLLTMLSVVLALACFNTSVSGQSAEDAKVASMNASGLSVRWNVAAQSADITMTISAPDGRVFRKEFPAGTSPEFTLIDQGERLPDGQYVYELRVSPVLSASAKKALAANRGRDDEPESVRSTRKRVEPAESVQSGGFSVVNGAVVLAGGVENGAPQTDAEPRPTRKVMEQSQLPGAAAPAAAITKVRQHHRLLGLNPDQVIPDDLIVQGSLCVGLDCVNNESFGFDTIRLKENNTRIKFEDTSVGTFPTNDWQLTANDSASGGSSKFSIEDITGARVPFTIRAGATTNSIFVDSSGRVGFRTSTPVLDLHVNTSNTPSLRLEQNNSGSFTAQTWDIGANEANFFVRDATNGSLLPLRIRPGAPTSSLDISADGDVGIGTGSPLENLDVVGNDDPRLLVRSTKGSVDNATTALRPTAGGSGRIDFQSAAGTVRAVIASTDGTDALSFATGGTTERVRITSIGRVGIGTTAPDQLLSVNGEASKTGANTWMSFSDERLKTIKGQFNTGLQALMQLQPIRYEYKRNNTLGISSEGEHIGFGAQAVQRVIPEAVTKSESGYLMINADPILWTMVNAIKEQQKQIEQLKAEIQQLKTASQKRE